MDWRKREGEKGKERKKHQIYREKVKEKERDKEQDRDKGEKIYSIYNAYIRMTMTGTITYLSVSKSLRSC